MKVPPDTSLDVYETLKRALKNTETSWSVGTFGALAEFIPDAHYPAHIIEHPGHLIAETSKGRLTLNPNDHMRLMPYEGLSKLPTAWTQGVLVLLPNEKAKLNHRSGVSEVKGDKTTSTMPSPARVVFDLGLGVSHLDACIRTDDLQLISFLRRHAGENLFSQTIPFQQRIKAANPELIFKTKGACLEIHYDISDDHQESLFGPNTLVSERLLSRNRTHAATLPVEEGWVPVLAFYPPNPVRDPAGQLTTFNLDNFIWFQSLMSRYGQKDYMSGKAAFYQAMAAQTGPDTAPSKRSKQQRTAIRIAIRQCKHRYGDSPLLERWRLAYEPAAHA